ncbi:MAG: metal ABC transporter permease [Eubacteriales bacterium]|nr:metal ABC transporter permease [Eubacteriales bacterium]
MNDMFQTLQYYFTFPFVRYALIVGVLVSLSASLLGVVLVLKRLSFLGDGLSHVAFGAMAIATVMGLSNNLALVLPITTVFSIMLMHRHRKQLQGDALIAMLSVSALAIGYILFNRFPPKGGNVSGDVCTTLFGSTSILTLSRQEVSISIILSAVVVLVFILFYNIIFNITFDEEFAASQGINTKMYNTFMAVVIAAVISLAMNLVGSLLISALLVFPAVSAMRVFSSFKKVVVASAILSVICSFSGIIFSILFGTPVGATIVAADLIGFLIMSVIGAFYKTK